MHDFEVTQASRPEFRGDEQLDRVTGEVQKGYPPTKRRLRQYCSAMVGVVAIVCVIAIFIGIRQ